MTIFISYPRPQYQPEGQRADLGRGLIQGMIPKKLSHSFNLIFSSAYLLSKLILESG